VRCDIDFGYDMNTNAWVLPDQISDVLPRQARSLEALRRGLLDLFKRFGYELVIPPLVEYTDALLDDEDEDLELRTVKWADHATGRTLAIRADMTSQVAQNRCAFAQSPRRGAAVLLWLGVSCACGGVADFARAFDDWRGSLWTAGFGSGCGDSNLAD
jgi:hypothetical protein